MTSDIKPYLLMKESGVEWLGNVPAHWRVRRLKYLLKERDARSLDGREQLLRVSQYTGVTQRRLTDSGEEPDTRAESLVGYKQVAVNDLVVNIMLAWNGSMGVSKFQGITSPAYCVYRFKEYAHPWYFHHLLRSPTYKARIKAVSTGVVESRLRLYTDDLFRLEALVPPLPEQAAIVRFLDHADRRIRRYIRAKQRLIALLEEQKQAIIQQAVTGQIDVRTGQPYPAYNPSGVKWLADMPAHWESKRLKAIARIRYGLGQPPREMVDGLPLIRATNVNQGRITEKNLLRVEALGVPKSRDGFLSQGEIIVVRSGAYTADSAIIPEKYDGAVAGYDMVVAVGAARPEFIAYALLSKYVRHDQLITASMRSAQPHLNSEELGTAIFLLPPIDEQVTIAAFLDRAIADLSTASQGARRNIRLVEEYRTRLISDIVTGKLDVREADAAMPAVDPPPTEDDVDNTFDTGADLTPEEPEASLEEAGA